MVGNHVHSGTGCGSHSGGHAHAHHDVTGDIRLAFFINLFFTALEIAGGIWTNSMAILADAVHDLGDSFALGSAWYFERISQREGDEYFSYGYRRFSLLGALISVITLVVGALFVLSEAVPRLFFPQPSHAPGMVVFAVAGILINGLAALRLRGKEGMNARMVAWHLLEDVLGWLAILVTGIVLIFWDVPVLDAVLSIVITCFVLYNVLKGFRVTMNIFLQGVPHEVDLPVIEREIRQIPGVAGTHHAHVWTLDGYRHVLTMHASLKGNQTMDDLVCLKNEIRKVIADHNIAHSTVELELKDEACRMYPEMCRRSEPEEP
ncbi:MAG TPA: cation diffusion facilitator family transporter [Deltaproteobacteria bacterium]|nr:cation diffusion facilitator family transporter [Deltaproteobacteria bacterium]